MYALSLSSEFARLLEHLVEDIQARHDGLRVLGLDRVLHVLLKSVTMDEACMCDEAKGQVCHVP